MDEKKNKNTSGTRYGKVLFTLSVISFFASSATILFMPFGSFEPDGNVILAYTLAITFWLFLALGLFFVLLLSRQRYKDIRFARMDGIMFLRFFKNKLAVVFDLLLIAGIFTLFISLIINRTLPAGVTLAGTFITVLSLEMHGIFNGKNYEWLCIV